MAGIAGLVVASCSSLANAAPFDLAWSAPAGCPSREAIVDATQARLGETSHAAPELFVQGTVTATSGGFVVTLALRDATGNAAGEREVRVEGESCKAIEEPASLVLAMMIAVARPRVEASSHPQERSEEAPAHVPAIETPTARPPGPVRPSAPAASPHPLFSLTAAGVTSLGVLPVAGFGVALRATCAPVSKLLLGLETSFEAGGTVRAGGGEVGFQLLSTSALIGVRVVRDERFELGLMALARVGWIRTLPTGFAVVQHETRTAVLAGPGVLARVRLSPHVFLEALPAVEVVFVRDRFQIRDGSKLYSVHRAAPVEARLSLGLGFDLP